MVTQEEADLDNGIARLLRDRFPEVGRIGGSGSLKVMSTTQVETEDPVNKPRTIHKVILGGTTDDIVLEAIKKLAKMVGLEDKMVFLPVPKGLDEDKFRKLVDLIFRRGSARVALHVPQTRITSQTLRAREAGTGNRLRRDREMEMLLVKQGEKSYRNMVTGLRTLVGNKEVKALKNVRQAQDGRLLLACKRGEPEVAELRTLIKEIWKDAVVTGGARGDSGKRAFHIKDLDVAVTDQEVWEAIQKVAPAVGRGNRREEADVRWQLGRNSKAGTQRGGATEEQR